MEARCLARTLHYSWPTCTWHESIELILLWRCLGRGGMIWITNFLGCKQWRSTNIVTPSMQILYLVSIGWRHVPSYFGEVTMALVYSPCFVARFCHYMSLVFCVEGHHQTCLNTTPRILDSKLCCHDQMQACRLWLAVAIPYLLLLRSTCHDPSFMPHYPSPFCEPTTIHLCHRPVLSFTLTGSHRQMCPCLR